MNLIVCEKLARNYSSVRVTELDVPKSAIFNVSKVEIVEISRIFMKFSEFSLNL